LAINGNHAVNGLEPAVDRLAAATEAFKRQPSVDIGLQEAWRELDCCGKRGHGLLDVTRLAQQSAMVEIGDVAQRISRMMPQPQLVEFKADFGPAACSHPLGCADQVEKSEITVLATLGERRLGLASRAPEAADIV
jgi:hypothetical protein